MGWFGCFSLFKSILAYFLLVSCLNSFGQDITFNDPDIITPIDIVPFVDTLIIEDAVNSEPRLDNSDPKVRLVDFDELPQVDIPTVIGNLLPNSGIKSIETKRYNSCGSTCDQSGFSAPNFMLGSNQRIEFDKNPGGQVGQISFMFTAQRRDSFVNTPFTLTVKLGTGEILFFNFVSRNLSSGSPPVSISKRITIAFIQDLQVDTITIRSNQSGGAFAFDDIQFRNELTRDITWRPQGVSVRQRIVRRLPDGSTREESIFAERIADRAFKLKMIGEDSIEEILSNSLGLGFESLQAIGVVESCTFPNIDTIKISFSINGGEEVIQERSLCPFSLPIDLPIQPVPGGYNVVLKADIDDKYPNEENEFNNTMVISIDVEGDGFDLAWNKENVFVRQTFVLDDGSEVEERVGNAEGETIELKNIGGLVIDPISGQERRIVEIKDLDVLIGEDAIALSDPFGDCIENNDRPVMVELSELLGDPLLSFELSACDGLGFELPIPFFEPGEVINYSLDLTPIDNIVETDPDNNSFILSLIRAEPTPVPILKEVFLTDLEVNQVFREALDLNDTGNSIELVNGKATTIELKFEVNGEFEPGDHVEVSIDLGNSQIGTELISLYGKVGIIEQKLIFPIEIQSENDFEILKLSIVPNFPETESKFVNINVDFVKTLPVKFRYFPFFSCSGNIKCFDPVRTDFEEVSVSGIEFLNDVYPVANNSTTTERTEFVDYVSPIDGDPGFQLDILAVKAANAKIEGVVVPGLETSGFPVVVASKDYFVNHRNFVSTTTGASYLSTVFVRDDKLEDGTIAHEFGHFLGLAHPELTEIEIENAYNGRVGESVDNAFDFMCSEVFLDVDGDGKPDEGEVPVDCFFANNILRPEWINRDNYEFLKERLQVPVVDPEVLVVGGLIDKNDNFDLKYISSNEAGFLTPSETDGEYTVFASFSDGTSNAVYSFNPSFSIELRQIGGGFGIKEMDKAVVFFVIEKPENLESFSIVKNNQIIEERVVNSSQLSILVSDLPDEAFKSPASVFRNVILSKIERYEDTITGTTSNNGESSDDDKSDDDSSEEEAPIISDLEKIAQKVDKFMLDEFTTSNPLQIEKHELLELIESLIAEEQSKL